MAAIPVNINGVIVDYYGRTIMGPVKIVGELSRSDVGIGGGPIIPPIEGEKPPPDSGLKPEHPIFYPPYPAHPIVLPPGNGGGPPVDPPVEPPSNPPNASWEWGWNPNTGWIPVYTPGDKPTPVPPPA